MAEFDLERTRRELQAHLPLTARWSLPRGVSLAFDFSRATKPLRPPDPSDIGGGALEEEWGALRLFGESDVSDGGGAQALIGAHEATGQVYGLDVERSSSPMFFYNSTADRFVRTFALFDTALGRGGTDGASLASRANEIESVDFHRSEWRLLADFLRTDGEGWR